jgi:hypothetical protein
MLSVSTVSIHMRNCTMIYLSSQSPSRRFRPLLRFRHGAGFVKCCFAQGLVAARRGPDGRHLSGSESCQTSQKADYSGSPAARRPSTYRARSFGWRGGMRSFNLDTRKVGSICRRRAIKPAAQSSARGLLIFEHCRRVHSGRRAHGRSASRPPLDPCM